MSSLRSAESRLPFDLRAVLGSAGPGTRVVTYQPREVIFSQGDPAETVFYLHEGFVRISVVSCHGKEAVVAILEPGTFFGESALAGHRVRPDVATAITPTSVVVIVREQMIRLIHGQRAFSERFLAHLLARQIRIEEDMVDQLLNASEKRLARALLLLSHYGAPGSAHRVLPPISQQTLAEMVGTTRSRVNLFLKKFRTRGYIEDRGGLTVNSSLVSVLRRSEDAGIQSLETAAG